MAATLDNNPTTGWAVSGHERKGDRLAVFTFEKPLSGGPGSVLVVRLAHQSQYAQHNIGRFRLSLTTSAKPSLDAKGGLPAEVVQSLGVEPGKRTAKQKQDLARHFRSVAPQLEPQRNLLATGQRSDGAFDHTQPTAQIVGALADRDEGER